MAQKEQVIYPNTEEVEQKIIRAINNLIEHDEYLLNNNLNERTISHKLAEYLQKEFLEWNVDCEYNRNHENVKRLNINIKTLTSDVTNAVSIYPDIIIHKRSEDYNCIIIEVKKNATEEQKRKDIYKIQRIISELKYKYGYFVSFKTGENAGLHLIEKVNNGRCII